MKHHQSRIHSSGYFYKETRLMLKQAIRRAIAQRTNREEGQGLVEYALILVLVAVVVIVILSQLGPSINNIFVEINDALGGDLVVSNEDNGPQCLNTNIANNYIEVPANGVLPPTTMQHSDANCTAADRGQLGWDVVYVSPNNINSARAKCNSAYSKQLRYTGTGTPEENSEIWPNSGFWYCQP
jgi:pilus assembly protein Flp/PilA